MSKRPRPWIVPRHDPIQKLEDDLWAVEGDVPGPAGIHRRMVIARRADGRLVFFNAMPLADDALAEIRAWGEPGWVVLPNYNHKIDAHAFRERLGVRLLCAASAAGKVGKVVTVDGRLDDLPEDPRVRLAPLGGTRQGETALVVASASGRTSVAFGDALMNILHPGLVTRMLGFGGAPKCPPVFRLAFVRDKRALAGDLAALAASPALTRLIPSHGAIVEHDAGSVLSAVVARDLGGTR